MLVDQNKSCLSQFSRCSILGRIIRVTKEVDEYREWIRNKWGSSSQIDLPLNSRFIHFWNVFLFATVNISAVLIVFLSSLCRKRCQVVESPAAGWMQQQRSRRRGGCCSASSSSQQNILQHLFSTRLPTFVSLLLPSVAALHVPDFYLQRWGEYPKLKVW